MKKARIGKRTLLNALALFFLLVLLFSAGMLLINLWESGQNKFDDKGQGSLESSIEYDGKKYVLKDGMETFLFIGRDKFEESVNNSSYNNDQQADFLMLLVIDNESSSYVAVQINRDTMTDVNVLGVAGERIDTVKQQIALSHTYGNGREVSCRNTSDAVSALFENVRIDHYVSLTMDAVSIVNDSVGGVEVTVLDDFSGIDDTLIKDTKVTLKGDQALTYVRSRYGMDDSTNQNRMIRQRQYLNSLYNEFAKCAKDDDSFIVDLSLKLADHIISDCSANKLQKLFQKISEYELSDIVTIEGKASKGTKYMEFYPDEDKLKKLIVETFYTPKK